MRYRWSLAEPCTATEKDGLVDAHNVSPLLAQCLVNRGLACINRAGRFLNPRLQDLADPFLLPDMKLAVDRLFRARANAELIVIFGDYDVDGVTATALVYEVLTALGWRVEFYLPHRMDEGYGLTEGAVQTCLARHPATLLLAVDCGSTAGGVIAMLQQRGVDAIVLDHHQVSSDRPPAVALVNPQLAPTGAPCFRELCSVGLAFKLAHALIKEGRNQHCPEAAGYDIRRQLDLVALGTVADLVPLTGENRILVNRGLRYLNETERPGLTALRKVAGIAGKIGGYEVGFQLAPRLNAAGRLENALEALHLLLAPDLAQAAPIAGRLDGHNRERQEIERNIAEQVIGAIKASFKPDSDYVIVEGQLLWHLGVVGIVASRVVQEFYRPAIILGGDANEWRGSGRSIEGFDLASALGNCRQLLSRHGGHAMAAGLSLHPDNVGALRQQLNDFARSCLTTEQLCPRLRLDADVVLRDINLARVTELALLQQTGISNPPVQLVARNLVARGPVRRMGKAQQHARLRLSDGTAECDAVWWRARETPLESQRFDLAFVPEINDYEGQRSVQLRILDWRPAEG